MPLNHITRLCGAKTRKGPPCANPAMENGRCRMHRGKAVKGIAHPNFKTGKYSKYLPERMLARYQEAQSDPNLIELRGEVALTDTFLADQLSKLDRGESGELWERLQDAFNDFQSARMAGDPLLEERAVLQL